MLTRRTERSVRSKGLRNPGKTPPFRGPRGELLAGASPRSTYRRLGGVEQWVMIRGESSANPPLILLHGGPGLSETDLFRYYNAPLEKSFTVVYWDQRGAGKSFDPAIDRSSMTVEQFVSDLGELVDACARGSAGRRWCSSATRGAPRSGCSTPPAFRRRLRPTSASGQIGDAAAGESVSYGYALAQAQRLDRRRLVRKLRALGPPPYGAREVFTERATWHGWRGHAS